MYNIRVCIIRRRGGLVEIAAFPAANSARVPLPVPRRRAGEVPDEGPPGGPRPQHAATTLTAR